MTPFELPTFAATWWPIYLETVPGSGERLTVGVVVRATGGQATVRQAIDPPHLRTMFGEHGGGMQFVVGNTVLKIDEQLRRLVAVDQLEMPFGGIELGTPHDGVARDLEEFVGLALRMSSGFAQSSFGQRRDSEGISAEVRLAFEEWTENVRLRVLSAQTQSTADWTGAFNVPVALSGGKNARFGFVFGQYVAQFGVLRAGPTASGDLRALKIKLFDLEVVRRERALQFVKADLIIGYQEPGDNLPKRTRQTLHDSLDHLHHEARARNVTLTRHQLASEAAEYVLTQARAA